MTLKYPKTNHNSLFLFAVRKEISESCDSGLGQFHKIDESEQVKIFIFTTTSKNAEAKEATKWNPLFKLDICI